MQTDNYTNRQPYKQTTIQTHNHTTIQTDNNTNKQSYKQTITQTDKHTALNLN
jgi:hypothetical protein